VKRAQQENSRRRNQKPGEKAGFPVVFFEKSRKSLSLIKSPSQERKKRRSTPSKTAN